MTESELRTTVDKLIFRAEVLIDSVEFDVNGTNGKGGHGGLVSIDTLRAVSNLRQQIHSARRSIEREQEGTTQ